MKRPADRRRVDRPDDFQLDQAVGQELHRPPRATFGGRRAGDGDQLRLLFAVELAVLPAGRPLAVQRRVQSLSGELLTHATDGHERAAQRLADPRVAPTVRAVGVRLEQDLRATEHRGGVRASADQPRERLTLLAGEADHHFVR